MQGQTTSNKKKIVIVFVVARACFNICGVVIAFLEVVIAPMEKLSICRACYSVCGVCIVFVECDGQHNYSCLAPSSTRNQRRKGK
jgi:hypothetical protein